MKLLPALLVAVSVLHVVVLPEVAAQEVEALPCPTAQEVSPTAFVMDSHLKKSITAAHTLATGAGIKVAVIDTGVAQHPRLPPLIAGGDLIRAHQQSGVPGEFVDCDGHGTIVAGIIAARPNPGSGWPYDESADDIMGIAPEADIIAIKQTSAYVRTTEDSLVGTLSTLADSIHRAIDAGAHIINISVVSCLPGETSNPAQFQPLNEALDRAEQSGVIVVAAAGNLSTTCEAGSTVYPAHSDTVLAVSARANAHTIAAYSMPSTQQILSAPSTVGAGLSPHDDGFASAIITQSGPSPFEGTSFATPVVSATAALLRQRFPTATPLEIRNRIFQSIDPARGAIDPYRALSFQSPGEPQLTEIALNFPTAPDTSTQTRGTVVIAVLCGLLFLGAVLMGLSKNRS
ncbi:type VII secretion-associated serine protease mycosin [Corynebacterium callunae]|uniref:type VII secretion-associated serine protease mycosin n=1 Tax=Corynebacterium callunae TaxID=1721 RepID=UPI003981FB9E